LGNLPPTGRTSTVWPGRSYHAGMLTRTLGRTRLAVSAIGFGSWNIGGQWGDVSDQTALATVGAALDAGVTFFDSADAYGDPVGRSETLMGQALRGARDRVVIATKVGNFARRQGHALSYTHPLHVELCCDASLNRMKIDTIDVYQCHIGDPPEPEVFWQAFDALKKKGKIRFAGISTNNVAALRKFDAQSTCDVVQLDYSLVNRVPEQELLPFALAQQIGVIVRGPLGMGLCAGKFGAETRFTDSVRQGWNDGPGREKFLANLKKIDACRFLEQPDRPLAQAALQFVISHPAVSTAIPGAKSLEQAQANARAGQAPLTPAELARID
jgi:myo-inositol catabolism protein IolS